MLTAVILSAALSSSATPVSHNAPGHVRACAGAYTSLAWGAWVYDKDGTCRAKSPAVQVDVRASAAGPALAKIPCDNMKSYAWGAVRPCGFASRGQGR